VSRHYRATDPGNGGFGSLGVESEDFDRFTAAVIDDVERVHAILAGTQIEAMRPEFAEVGRARAIAIGRFVGLEFRVVARKQHLPRFIPGID